MHVIIRALLLLLLVAVPSWAQPTPVTVSWELAALPVGTGGAPQLAVLWLTPAPGYKAYANDPGQSGMPTRARVRLTPTGQNLPVLYPPGKSGPDLYEKDKTVNEPVQFYVTSKSRVPYELVINEVRKDTLVGYLSMPKVKLTAQR